MKIVSLVRGKHKPLITEELFLKVNGELKTDGFRQNKAENELPLKGFVRDLRTNEKFTGYLAKKKKIFYYKVNKKGVRVNRSQKMMHEIFIEELEKLCIDPKMIPVIKDNLVKTWRSETENLVGNKISLVKRIKELEEYIDKAEFRHTIGEISADVFKRNVSKFIEEKAELEKILRQYEFELSNPDDPLDFLLQLRMKPSLLWTHGDYYHKRRYQELIFPEGIWFDAENNAYRTKRINSAFLQKSDGSRPPDENKEGTPHLVDEKSHSVHRRGLELFLKPNKTIIYSNIAFISAFSE